MGGAGERGGRFCEIHCFLTVHEDEPEEESTPFRHGVVQNDKLKAVSELMIMHYHFGWCVIDHSFTGSSDERQHGPS